MPNLDGNHGIGTIVEECPKQLNKSENDFKGFSALQTKIVATRFELATSASRTQRSTKLSHATIQCIIYYKAL